MKRQSAGGLVLSLFVAASLHAAQQAALEAQSNEEKQITIRLRNYARMDSGVLLKAESIADKILQATGANTVWVLCFDGSSWSRDAACTSLPSPMDLTVNVLSFPASHASHLKGDAFGFATEEGEQGFGCDAWIFYSPIRSFAVERELSLAQLLGHVLAHELGHMLLGANSHSGVGLMRALWSGRELHAADQGELFFSAPESERIQKAVLARWQVALRGVHNTKTQQTTRIRLLPELR